MQCGRVGGRHLYVRALEKNLQGSFVFFPFYLFISEILHTFAGRTRRKDDELNDDVTMDTLHIIAVVALIIIGGYIYWNKTRG